MKEVKYLKEEQIEGKLKRNKIKAENKNLTQIFNTKLFERDKLERYSRRENTKTHRVTDIIDKKDNGEKVAIKTAKVSDVERSPEL